MKNKSFAIIGLGRFGLSLLQDLALFTDNIIAIDKDEEAVNEAAKYVNQCYIMESANENFLKEKGVDNVSTAIICFGSNFEATILTLVSLKNIGIKNIVVRCDQTSYRPILEKLGATDIVSPQKLAGNSLANSIYLEVDDYYRLSGDYCIIRKKVETNSFNDITIQKLDSRNKYGVNILLIRRTSQEFAPKASDVIKKDDILFLVGKRNDIEKFAKKLEN